MARPHFRLRDIRINIFSVAACLALLAAPCIAWANATQFRDMSNNIVRASGHPPNLLTIAMWIMAAGGAVAMAVSWSYARKRQKDPAASGKSYALSAVLPFYIVPAILILGFGMSDGWGTRGFEWLAIILFIVTLFLVPVWLVVRWFHRRLQKLPEGARARAAKCGFAALGLFTVLIFSLPVFMNLLACYNASEVFSTDTFPVWGYGLIIVWTGGLVVFPVLLVLAFLSTRK